jgi:predicted nucleic acid-binding protein
MTPVFLDTSGLIASVNTADQWYSLVKPRWRQLCASGRPLLTTSLVLIEVDDGLSRVDRRRLALNLRQNLIRFANAVVVQVSAQDEQRAWDLFEQRLDKSWGMTDCISMIIM